MKSEFARVITLLRKEKNISQKQAAAELGIGTRDYQLIEI